MKQKWQGLLKIFGLCSFYQFSELKREHEALQYFVDMFFQKLNQVTEHYNLLHKEYAPIFINTDKKLAEFHNILAEHAEIINKMVAIHNKNVLRDDFIIPNKITHEN